MNKKIILGLTILTTFVLIGCNQQNAKTISWEEAINILNSGKVNTIGQAHSLEVTFTLNNGSVVKTIETNIDDIFDEVKKCGDPCKNIPLATE